MNTTFGPFELDRLLGVGGTAEVFVAHRSSDPNGDRFVLKRVRPELATNEEFSRRLELEAQIGAALTHPNLVRFVEYGRVGDCRYLVFEHVRGFNLSRALEAARAAGVFPDQAAALALAKGIFGALGAMHGYVDDRGDRRPVLHRDVTPNNVVLTADGRPVLIDLGIAKDVLGPAITQIGKVIGTARYMSPEHKSNEILDERTDVFSASVVLFEALSGHPPWPKLPGAKELLRTIFDPPEIEPELAARVSRPVLDVLLRGLACDRADRFRNASEMLSAFASTPAWQECGMDGDASWEAVRRFLDAAKATPDEDLDKPVVHSVSAQDAAPVPVRWTSDGHIQPSGMDTKPPQSAVAATVFDVPPLPPKRHALNLTREILLTPELTTEPERRWLGIGVGVIVLIAGLGWLFFR